ncbi:MAG: RNA 2',3'-cyclic phosphodiesterase [Thiobacillus sp.]
MTETTAAETESLRLFFALWPDEATRDALNHTGKWLHKHWGGRRMRADTLHLTLVFLGRTPVGQLDALFDRVDSLHGSAFELTLDQPGYWRHNRIVWLGASQPPSQLGALVSGLNTAVQQSGIPFDARPHVPHVTLLRNTAGGEMPPCKPVHWPGRDFVLVASRPEADGAHYEVLRRWPLR